MMYETKGVRERLRRDIEKFFTETVEPGHHDRSALRIDEFARRVIATHRSAGFNACCFSCACEHSWACLLFFVRLPYGVLQRISSRIVSEVRGVNRVG